MILLYKWRNRNDPTMEELVDNFAGKKGFTGLRYPNYSQLIEQSTFPEDVWAYIAAKQPSRKEGYDTTTRVSFVHKLDK